MISISEKRTREDIITSMCFTWRHDYGLDRDSAEGFLSGTTKKEREDLWRQMAQIFDNDIAPHMDFKNNG